MHGLIHWLAGAYGKRGITVNGVAPALIEETKMLPGSTADLAARIFPCPPPPTDEKLTDTFNRHPNRQARQARRDRRDGRLDGQDGIRA